MAMNRFSPLPFGRDVWITSIISSMVYIVFLMCVCCFVVNVTAHNWSQTYAKKVIIQLPLSATDSMIPEKAVFVLKEDEGIENYKFVDKATLDNLTKLLASTPDIKIPSFIQVQVNKKWNFQEFDKKLKAIHPEFNIVDTHAISSKFMNNLSSLERVFYLLCLIVFSASILVVLVVTRFEVAVHQNIIHTLYLLGAKDHYISSHFQKRGRRFGFKGGFLGVLMGFVTCLVFFYFSPEYGTITSMSAFLLGLSCVLPVMVMLCCDMVCKFASKTYIQKFQQKI